VIDEIIQGDCFALLPTLPAGSVDLIFTDPPYKTALADIYKDWNGVDWDRLGSEFDRILKPSGQVALFADYQTGLAIGNAFQKYFAFRFYFVWVKNHGQPIGKKQPISNTELILVWKHKKAKTSDLTFNPQYEPGRAYRKLFNGENPTRKKHNGYLTNNVTGDRFPTQTLYYPAKDNLPQAERVKGMPCQKSLALIGYLVKSLSNPGELILDSFSGSGTTAIACHRLDRKFICIERDSGFYTKSVKRLENEMTQSNLL